MKKICNFRTEFEKISYENSRFVEKYQNVDIDSIYSKCRTLESKLDYFKRVAEREVFQIQKFIENKIKEMQRKTR